MAKITVNRESCEGCGDCVAACTAENVIEMFEGVVITNEQSSCSKCLLCEEACPTGVIKISSL